MEDLEALKENFDFIGLSETHCTEETRPTWTDGTLFGAEIHAGARDPTANKGGVGFIILPGLIASKRVQEFRIVSSRIAVLKLGVPGQRRPLKVIQVYAPHSGYDDDIIEQFYDEVREQLDESACRPIVIGDLNARLGRRKEDEQYIGTHSSEQRNESGEMLESVRGTSVGASQTRCESIRSVVPSLSQDGRLSQKVLYLTVALKIRRNLYNGNIRSNSPHENRQCHQPSKKSQCHQPVKKLQTTICRKLSKKTLLQIRQAATALHPTKHQPLQ